MKKIRLQLRPLCRANLNGMKRLVVCLLLFGAPISGQDTGVSVQNAKDAAREISQQLESCAVRTFVGEFTEQRKHPAWVKETFGPPIEIEMDVKKNDSLLYPYLVVAEFTLWLRYSPDFKTRAEAEQSSADNPLMKSRNRNVYLLGDDGLRLKTTEVLSGNWTVRPRWEDACWDQLSTATAGGK